jgi:hypothetical protein
MNSLERKKSLREGDSARARFYRLKDEVFPPGTSGTSPDTATGRAAAWLQLCKNCDWEKHEESVEDFKQFLVSRHGADLDGFLREECGGLTAEEVFDEECARRHLPKGSTITVSRLKPDSPMHLAVSLRIVMSALDRDPENQAVYAQGVEILDKIQEACLKAGS